MSRLQHQPGKKTLLAAAEGNNGWVVPMVGSTNWLNMDDKEGI
jgi:hypothetical protein